MVDTIIVGRFVGVNALAAVGATGSMFFLVNGMIQGLTSGFAVLVAQKFGAKEEISLKKAVASNINLTIISTIVITIVALIVKTPLLKAMNTPDNIFKDETALDIEISNVSLNSDFFESSSALACKIVASILIFFFTFSKNNSLLFKLSNKVKSILFFKKNSRACSPLFATMQWYPSLSK